MGQQSGSGLTGRPRRARSGWSRSACRYAGQRSDERASRRESIGLAFITALQLLSPRQRAALLLVDVLGWKPQKTAARLETSVFSVSSLLQRARKSVEAQRKDSAPPDVSSADADLLRRFIDRSGRGVRHR